MLISSIITLKDVGLTTLYVSSKLHDTLKKPRDIILASYAIRYPDLLKNRLILDISTIDSKQLETDRRKMLSIERLVLETICFNFLEAGFGAGSEKADAFGLVIKLGKKMGCKAPYFYYPFPSWPCHTSVYSCIFHVIVSHLGRTVLVSL